MRIAVLTSLYPSPELPFEGIFAARRWQGMAARGHTISICIPLPWAPLPIGRYRNIARAPKNEIHGGIPVHRPRYLHLPGRARGNAQRFARVGLAKLPGDVDCVVCDYAWPASSAATALRAKGIACVVNGRGSDVLQVAGEAGLGPELAANLRAAGHWCAVSQDLVDAMDRLAERPGQGLLVPNGVDHHHFTPGERAAARGQLGIEPGGPMVLVVGHLIERKDPILSLESFAQGAPPEARLYFVGRGPLESAVRERAQALGIEDRVTLAGERPPEELLHWYRAADLLLLTSSREGRPNVVLEALACGTPVLATQAGGTGELLPDPSMLSESRDAKLLGDMLRDLLLSPPNPDSLRSMALPLSWEASLQTLEACIEQARSEGASQHGSQTATESRPQ